MLKTPQKENNQWNLFKFISYYNIPISSWWAEKSKGDTSLYIEDIFFIAGYKNITALQVQHKQHICIHFVYGVLVGGDSSEVKDRSDSWAIIIFVRDHVKKVDRRFPPFTKYHRLFLHSLVFTTKKKKKSVPKVYKVQ